MKWIELKDIKDDEIWTGAIFRCYGVGSHEEIVDLMVIDYETAPSGFALVVTTGFKAGHIMVQLPEESRCIDKSKRALSKSWLIQNWRKWIYRNGPEGVLFLKNYPPQNS